MCVCAHRERGGGGREGVVEEERKNERVRGRGEMEGQTGKQN